MSAQLENQNIVIIGASSGIGLAVAKLIAARGAKIALDWRAQNAWKRRLRKKVSSSVIY